MLLERTPKEYAEYHLINIAPKKRSMEGRTLFDRIVISGIECFKFRKQLKRELSNGRVDVIHMTTSGQLALFRDLLLLKIARKRSVPVIYHIRFGRIKEIAEKNTLEWKLIKKAMGLSTAIIAIDNTTFGYLQTVFENKVHYIPNPIDMNSLPIITGEKKEVSFLGWCIKTKGIEELIGAWEKLKKDEWTLNIVGPYSKGYIDALKERYSFNRIKLWGELEHKKAMELMGSSSIFVLPSYTEGFPNVVLEAMAMRKAVIATKVGAIPDMLLNNCGELIEKQNIDQLEEALYKLMNNETIRNEYSCNGYQRVKDNYEFGVVFKQYRELWNYSRDTQR